jgi:hypothetical protein
VTVVKVASGRHQSRKNNPVIEWTQIEGNTGGFCHSLRSIRASILIGSFFV